MSGSSFNYLSSAHSLCERAEDVRAITRELATIVEKHPDCLAALAASAHVANLLAEAQRRALELEKVWHAVEWHVSGDMGEDTMLKVLRAFRMGNVMPAPLTRAQLDHMGCGRLGCQDTHEEGLYIHARCHPSAPVEAWYRGGVLTFRCKRCSSLVAEVAVAEGTPVS